MRIDVPKRKPKRFRNGIVSGLVESVHLDVEPKRNTESELQMHLPADVFYVSVIGDVANRGDVESVTVTPPLRWTCCTLLLSDVILQQLLRTSPAVAC